MKALTAGSVDLVFADPPFNIGYDYDEYDDRKQHESYLEWSRDWIAAAHRVLKSDGAFWLAIGDEYAAELKLVAQNQYSTLPLGDAGFFCRSWVIWYYTFGVHCTRKFTRSHAHLFHFVKHPKRFTFNADAIRVPSARQLVYNDKRANPTGRMPDDTWLMPGGTPTAGGFVLRPQDLPDGFTPESNTWFFSRVAGTFAEREGWHGCQMPEQLLGRIIRASSNEGDTVLDPFAGSGTTLAVARKLGRQCIGFELSKQYFQQATARLRSARAGDPLDGAEDPLTSAPATRNGGNGDNSNGKSRSSRGGRRVRR
jgi:site-specific DNA-methyltransferase (adenine-specific)